MDWSSAGTGALLLAVVAALAKLAELLIHRGERRESRVVRAAGDAIELWQKLAEAFEKRAADLELLVDQGRDAERAAHYREVAGLEARLARHGEHVRSLGPAPRGVFPMVGATPAGEAPATTTPTEPPPQEPGPTSPQQENP